MLVSIIIPTFNRLTLLKRAIASVQAQTFCDYELIIVDDASTDGTQEFVKNSNHTLICLAQNKGVSHARNMGVKKAKGSLIAFLDSDDVWEKDKLQTQVDFHQSDTGIQCSFGIEQWFRYKKQVKRPSKYHAPKIVNFEDLLAFTFIGPSSVMINKELFEKLDGFDEQLKVCEDFDLWLRLSKIAPLHLSERTLIQKHAGDHDHLAASVLSLEPFRVRALMKHKDDKCVKNVIQIKLDIIKKGATKHQNHELLDFCLEHEEKIRI